MTVLVHKKALNVNRVGRTPSGRGGGRATRQAVSLNHTRHQEGRAICQAIFLDGPVPEWVELIPAGATIRGRDGRRFTNKSPQAVLDAFALNGADLPLDWEHSTELKAPAGDPAPAAAWIVELQVRDGGSIWGKIDWTEQGRQAVETKAYRYLSPVFLHDKSKNVIALLSAGLTNSPNLHLTALNRAHEEKFMDREALITLLGLAKTATDDEIKTALNRQTAAVGEAATKITALTAERDKAVGDLAKVTGELETAKAVNTSSTGIPPLTQYVPRADHELAINRATEAEGKLAGIEAAKVEAAKVAHTTSVDTAITEATKTGKIAPSSVEYYKSTCKTAEGLVEFQKFVSTAPAIVPPSGLDGTPVPGGAGAVAALTGAQKTVCRNLGLTEEDYLKSLNATQAQAQPQAE